ncbi:uncharacterized protein LOC108742980 [Agrilus planipennis]|uniref:Uncharacterized protein LOC108742980 n=1 Tax=Agrilus planipennis TaxID=224129 RepID=A0A1W4XCY1_AGRPL|nr:uncharacterized protein LOC108742980 [Agrilus planipennis]
MIVRLLQNKYGLQARLLQGKCTLQSHSQAFYRNKTRAFVCSNVCNIRRYPKLLKVDSQNICRRMFYSLFKRPTMEELQLSDKVPEQFVLIYNNRMKNYLLYGHFTIYLCIAMFIIVVLLKNGSSFKSDNKAGSTSKLFEQDQLIFLSALITFAVIVQSLILRMPVRIYNNPKTNHYAFIYYGLIPNNKRKLFCKLSDIIKQEEKGLLPWKDSRFIIKERDNVILIHEFFRTPSDLNIILGYEKPPNEQ